jgi:hypothetical protein
MTETSVYDDPKLWQYLSARSEECTETGCRLWKRALQPDGYGAGYWSRKHHSAHRLAYLFYHKGDLPSLNEEGRRLVIRHLCNNKACIAENHLVIGTCTDNANDIIRSGNAPIGEKGVNAKITDEMAKKIIDSYYPPGHPNYKTRVQRAKELGVPRTTLVDIDLKYSWKHLPRTFEYVPEIKGKRKKSVLNSTAVSEEKAREVLASKRHKHDPDYMTQRERAQFHGIKHSTLRSIDSGCIMGHLPQPVITPLPKPERSLNDLKDAFEKVKSHCKYAEENNTYMGTPCLEWQGKLWKLGRPRCQFKGLSRCAYIFSCEYHEGRFLEKGMQVRHLCNNPKCCEPTHLKMGTVKENSHDKLVHAADYNYKLNFDKVREIRERAVKEGLSTVEIGRQYNITTRHAWWVLKNNAWKE